MQIFQIEEVLLVKYIKYLCSEQQKVHIKNAEGNIRSFMFKLMKDIHLFHHWQLLTHMELFAYHILE